jgi:hypothetical protein
MAEYTTKDPTGPAKSEVEMNADELRLAQMGMPQRHTNIIDGLVLMDC